MSDIIELEAPAAAPQRSSHAKVLVVDDAITVRLFYRQLLEETGFVVDEAANGLEGLEKLLADPADLVVVDVNMPKMDGYAMLRALRGEASVRAVPALMISTESQPRDADAAYAAGANFYLTKPVRPEEFLAVVRLMTGTPS